MSNYSHQVNQSYESVDECNISSGSEYSSQSVEMSRERWNNSMGQRRSLNSSQEESPHTYINPLINVPSYTPDRYYSRKPNNHVYHPILVQQSPNTPNNMYNNYQQGYNYQNINGSMYYNRPPPSQPLYLRQSPQLPYRQPPSSYNQSPQNNFRPHPHHRFNNHISPQNNHRFRPSYHNNNYNNFKPPQNNYRRQNYKKREHQRKAPVPTASNVEVENENDSSGDSNMSEEMPNETLNYKKYLAEKEAKEALESSADCSKTDCSLMDCSTANETMESSINQTIDQSQITDTSATQTADSSVPDLESSVDHTMPNETCTDSEYLESSVANETFGTSMNQTFESSVNESSFEPVQYVVTNQPILFPTVDSSGNPLLVQAENVQVFSMPLPFSNNPAIGQIQNFPIPFTFSTLPMITQDNSTVPGTYDNSTMVSVSYQNSGVPVQVQETGNFELQLASVPVPAPHQTHPEPDQSFNSTIDPNPAESSVCDETKSDFDKTDKTVNASDDSGVKPGNDSSDTADDSGVRAENESYEMNESDIRPEHESSGIVEDMKNPEHQSDDQELPKTTEINVQPYQLDEDSCNAVDHNISRSASNEYSSDLSFNGKFNNINNSEKKDSFNIPNMISQLKAQCENSGNVNESDNSLFNKSEISIQEEEEETEEEKLRNESFEMLKNEDSTMMLYVNEKSPEPNSSRNSCDIDLPKIEYFEQEKIVGACSKTKSAKNDVKIYNRLKQSLLGICPPPSVTNIPYSLEQITLLYKNNKNKAGDPVMDFKSEERDSFFKPTHSSEQVLEMTDRINDGDMSWRELMHIKSHDVFYNRSTYCENIERMCLKYSEKFVGGETSSSINILKSPSSIKKKNEKFKLLTQSPGSRLSHLARRRTMFSSANLKSALAPSQPSVSSSAKPLVSRQILIDKKKTSLLQKSTKSPRKKTPGRRKTPKSAKRQSQLQLQSQQRLTTITSKRALFTSPPKSTSTVENRPSTSNVPNHSQDLTSRLQRSKRALFSPIDGKRKRTESADSNDSLLSGNLLKPTKKAKLENSPNKFMKSLSFSVAGSGNSSSSSISEASTLHRRSLFRTQSESYTQSQSQSSISFRQPLTEEHTRKLLWAVSSALANKQISKDHEKFKDHARLLVKLTKKIFVEFYDPLLKSTSNQMLKIANGMVFYVIQGRSYEDIYALTKEQYQKTKNLTKVSGYITQEEYEKNRRNLVRKNSTLLFQSVSTSSTSLNIHSSSENIADSNSRMSSNLGSTSKKSIISSDNTSSGSKTDRSNRSSSKNNENMGALRENFLRDNSGQKNNQRTSENDNNGKLFVGKANSNLLKAKRQISF